MSGRIYLRMKVLTTSVDQLHLNMMYSRQVELQRFSIKILVLCRELSRWGKITQILLTGTHRSHFTFQNQIMLSSKYLICLGEKFRSLPISYLVLVTILFSGMVLIKMEEADNTQAQLITAQLRQTIAAITHQNTILRNDFDHHKQLADHRIEELELQIKDHENRLRQVQDSATQFKLLASLATGGGLVSLIALLRTLI